MTNEEAIAIIENEKKCVNRANKNDYCNRDCYNCELVKTDAEILTALDMAIKALEQTTWIPVSERLPEIKQHVLLSCYGRVIYGRMISEDGNSGYPVFEICDSVGEKRPIVLETTVHSEFTTSRIIAWMPLPEPYKAESEDKE